MLAGVFGSDGRQPLAGAGESAERHDGGCLQMAWTGPTQSHRSGSVTVLLDGFLVGDVVALEEVAERWRRIGESLTKTLRGGFTILIWDHAAQAGILACDPFSLRPCLVSGVVGGPLRFATHMPTMRRLLPTDPGPDPEVMAPWLAPQHLQGHKTMLAGVERVGAAHMVRFGTGGWTRLRYWGPRWRGTTDAPRDELVARLRTALDRSIDERLSRDGLTGTILSGGLDSSVVLGTAAGRSSPERLRAYSTVFPEWPAADESARIAATTEFLGVEGVRFRIRPQGALRLALEQLDASGTVPGGPGGLVERPGVERAVADGVRVLFDGQGGDELFGRSPYLLADRLRRGDAVGVLRLLRRTVPYLRRRSSWPQALKLLRDFGVRPGLARAGSFAGRLRAFQGESPAWLRPATQRVLEEVHDPWPWLTNGGDAPFWWAHHAYLLTDHFEGSGLGEHLWERAAPFGIRSAGPLFDIELVELVLQTPPEVMWQPRDRPLARAAMRGRLPERVRANPFKANIGPFYLDLLTGPDHVLIQELLLDPGARVREFVDSRWLDHNVVRRPTRDAPDWSMWMTVLWRLVMAECWMRWLEDPLFAARMLDRPDLPAMDAASVA